MDINLEKIDIIRERTGVSYKEAKDALEKFEGDIVEAIIFIEENENHSWKDAMSTTGNEIIEKLRVIIQKGNVSRIVIRKEGDILLNIPVTAGAIGIILAPVAALLGMSAALATKTTIEIIKTNGEVVDLNGFAVDTVSEIKNKVKAKKDDTFDNFNVDLDPEDEHYKSDDLDE